MASTLDFPIEHKQSGSHHRNHEDDDEIRDSQIPQKMAEQHEVEFAESQADAPPAARPSESEACGMGDLRGS
jgi:hypothetical protein